MLGVLTVVLMLAVAYAFLREGLFTAFVMLVNTLLAGLFAFNFWEPLADVLDPMFASSFLRGYEDAFALVPLFAGALGLLRWATNNLAPMELQFPLLVLRIGSAVCGLATGYLAAGFLVCVYQTLPWHEQFLGYEARHEPAKATHPIRRVLPPDRVWLSLMHRAGLKAFSRGKDETGEAITFDRNGNFSLRYERYRRYGDTREALADDRLVLP